MESFSCNHTKKILLLLFRRHTLSSLNKNVVDDWNYEPQLNSPLKLARLQREQKWRRTKEGEQVNVSRLNVFLLNSDKNPFFLVASLFFGTFLDMCTYALYCPLYQLSVTRALILSYFLIIPQCYNNMIFLQCMYIDPARFALFHQRKWKSSHGPFLAVVCCKFGITKSMWILLRAESVQVENFKKVLTSDEGGKSTSSSRSISHVLRQIFYACWRYVGDDHHDELGDGDGDREHVRREEIFILCCHVLGSDGDLEIFSRRFWQLFFSKKYYQINLEHAGFLEKTSFLTYINLLAHTRRG